MVLAARGPEAAGKLRNGSGGYADEKESKCVGLGARTRQQAPLLSFITAGPPLQCMQRLCSRSELSLRVRGLWDVIVERRNTCLRLSTRL